MKGSPFCLECEPSEESAGVGMLPLKKPKGLAIAAVSELSR